MSNTTTTPEIRTESQGHIVSSVAISMCALAAGFLGLRLYTRLSLLRTAGNDDWTIIVAMLLSVIVTVATCYEVKYGMGRHVENVTFEETVEQLKFLLVSVLHYNVAMNIVKISFLFQYRRIFQSKRVQTVCLWAMASVIIWGCTQAVLLAISCLPISVILPNTASYCLDTLPIWYFSSAMSLATDIMIFSIPLPSVLKLQLPIRAKVMLFGIFCLGFFVCIISVYRFTTLRTAVYSEDPPWENIGAAIWSSIELNTAIICASLPTLRPLVSKLMPGSGLSSNKGGDSSAYGRYGSNTGTRRSNFKELKSSPRTISTEELALKDMGAGQSESTPGVYSHVKADPELGYGSRQPGHDHNEKRIMVTTETRVRVDR